LKLWAWHTSRCQLLKLAINLTSPQKALLRNLAAQSNMPKCGLMAKPKIILLGKIMFPNLVNCLFFEGRFPLINLFLCFENWPVQKKSWFGFWGKIIWREYLASETTSTIKSTSSWFYNFFSICKARAIGIDYSLP